MGWSTYCNINNNNREEKNDNLFPNRKYFNFYRKLKNTFYNRECMFNIVYVGVFSHGTLISWP